MLSSKNQKTFCSFVLVLGLHRVFVPAWAFFQLRRAGATLRCSSWVSHCTGFSCCAAQALAAQAPVVAASGLSCPTVCGIFPVQGSNLHPLHWQADYLPLSHQGSPRKQFESFFLLPIQTCSVDQYSAFQLLRMKIQTILLQSDLDYIFNVSVLVTDIHIYTQTNQKLDSM